MSTGRSDRGETTPAAEWTTAIEGIQSARLCERANVAVVDYETATTVSVVDTTDGSERGRIELEGGLEGVDYHEDTDHLFLSTIDDRVYAVDPTSARVTWEVQASNVGPTIGGTTYLYGGAALWAYRTSDGTRQWRTTLPDEICYNGLAGTIGHLGDRLVVGVGEFRDLGIVGVDPDTGDEAWYYRPDGIEYGHVDDDRLYVCFDTWEDSSDDLVRIDVATGSPQWTYTAEASLDQFSVYPLNETVYLREYTNGTVAAVDAATGREQWRSEGYRRMEDMWLTDEHLYANMRLDGPNGYAVLALDPGTGRTTWETEVDGEVYTVAEIDRGTGDIYAGTRERKDDGGTAYRLNASTGRIRWRFETGKTIREMHTNADPIVVRGENTLYGVERTSGRTTWSFADEWLNVLHAGDRYVLAGGDGQSYVLDRTDGTVLWRIDTEVHGHTNGDDCLLVWDDATLSAHPLGGASEALQSAGGNDTVVHSSEASAGSGDTAVYDPGTDTGSTDRDTDTPSFCPNCGTDLGEYDAVNFCPDCGEGL